METKNFFCFFFISLYIYVQLLTTSLVMNCIDQGCDKTLHYVSTTEMNKIHGHNGYICDVCNKTKDKTGSYHCNNISSHQTRDSIDVCSDCFHNKQNNNVANQNNNVANHLIASFSNSTSL